MNIKIPEWLIAVMDFTIVASGTILIPLVVYYPDYYLVETYGFLAIIIAVPSLALGIALGGTFFVKYCEYVNNRGEKNE